MQTAGGVLSITVMLNWHDAELPAMSIAVQVTAVVPSAKSLPLAGVHVTLVNMTRAVAVAPV